MNRTQIERIEGALSPQQAALRLFAPILEAGTPEEYVVRFYDAHLPGTLTEQLDRIHDSTGAGLRGRTRDEVRTAQRAAVAEFVFMRSLLCRINTDACERWDVWTHQTYHAATESMHVTLTGLIEAKQLVAEYPLSLHYIHTERERAATFLDLIAPDFAGTLAAAERISRTYAGGAPMLFKGAVQTLEYGVLSVGHLRQALEEEGVEVDGDQKARIEEYAVRHARAWVDWARYDVYEFRGDRGEQRRRLDERIQRVRERTQ